MKDTIIKTTYLLLFFTLPFMAFATDGDGCKEEEEVCEEQGVELPKVFLIGEYSEEFERASEDYGKSLMDACGQDMRMAYIKWMTFLYDIEDYAADLNVDIMGLKMWVKVFWNEEGGIDHIGYYLKPRSKNFDADELKAFFMSFISGYTFPVKADEKFSHYGTTSFPIMQGPGIQHKGKDTE